MTLSDSIEKILSLILAGLALAFIAFWLWNIAGCLARKDFRPSDKFFWFAVLLIPLIGLMLYRGFANEFYKKRNV